MKRKTSSKKARASLTRMKEWIKKNRTTPVDDLMKKIISKLNGYYRYYGVTDNILSLQTYRYHVEIMLYKWLNKRSQRRSFTWKKFDLFLKSYCLPRPKIYVNIFKLRENISYIL